MYELFILVALVTAIVLFIRSGKPAEPLVIHTPGLCHITLAPSLAGEQGFIEQIASRFMHNYQRHGSLPCQYYRVNAAEENGYLLAVALRKGTLYFQAIAPHPGQHDQLQFLKTFSDAVLVQLPFTGEADAVDLAALCNAVDTVAGSSGKSVRRLD